MGKRGEQEQGFHSPAVYTLLWRFLFFRFLVTPLCPLQQPIRPFVFLHQASFLLTNQVEQDACTGYSPCKHVLPVSLFPCPDDQIERNASMFGELERIKFQVHAPPPSIAPRPARRAPVTAVATAVTRSCRAASVYAPDTPFADTDWSKIAPFVAPSPRLVAPHTKSFHPHIFCCHKYPQYRFHQHQYIRNQYPVNTGHVSAETQLVLTAYIQSIYVKTRAGRSPPKSEEPFGFRPRKSKSERHRIAQSREELYRFDRSRNSRRRARHHQKN